MRIHVRRATLEDVPWLSDQLKAFATSLQYKNSYLPPPDRLAGILSCLITDHIVLLGLGDGRPAGVIGGEYMPHPLNPSLTMLFEHFWWVDPNFRNAALGSVLLERFIIHGRNRADVIKLSLEHNTKLPDGFLERYGFKLAEKTYILE